MVSGSAFSTESSIIDKDRLTEGLLQLGECFEDSILPLKDATDVDYPLFRDAIIQAHNRAAMGVESLEDIDHPLHAYVYPTEMTIGYDYLEDKLKSFFVDYPEAHQITGVNYDDLLNMTVYDFSNLEEMMKSHYNNKLERPDAITNLLVEFREFVGYYLKYKDYNDKRN